MGFLKPHVSNQGLLDNTPGDPDGYVTRERCKGYTMGRKEKRVCHYT